MQHGLLVFSRRDYFRVTYGDGTDEELEYDGATDAHAYA